MQDDYRTHDPEIRAALQLVSEGTEYFDRTCAALTETHAGGASLVPDWSRRHVIAHVAYNAQALARLVDWASTGVENPMYESTAVRNAQIDEGSTLPLSELRLLCRDAADALDAGWRGLSDESWHSLVGMSTGPLFAATRTIWLRTREVWIHAVDLDNGASFTDFPPQLIEHLVADVVSTWRRRGDETIPNFVLTPTDHGVSLAVGEKDDPEAVRLSGTAVDLARWATGRSYLGVTSDTGSPAPTPPRWI